MNSQASAGADSQLCREALVGFLERSLACPKCRTGLMAGRDGYLCYPCGTNFPRLGSYVDFLGVNNCTLGTVQTDFSDHYVMPHTPYWGALRQVTEHYSASLPAVFSALLGRPARCLDVGLSLVAAGHIKPHLQGYTRSLCVYCCVDPDAKQLVCADDRLFMARAVGEFLPFLDEVFDVVLIHATLDHCFDYRKALDECARVLVPEGVVSIILNNDHSWAKRLLPWEARRRRRLATEHHNVFLGPGRLAKEMQWRGLKIERLLGMRYLLLPSSSLEALTQLCGSWTPRLLTLIDQAGNCLAPTLGGDFHLISRKHCSA